MDKIQGNARTSLQPLSKVIVTCRGKDGANNGLSVAYCCNCSYDPPMVMVGIVPSRHSHKMIKETGSFVVNLVSKDQSELFNYFGKYSGRDVDKFKETGASVIEAVKVNAPMLKESPVNIECKVVDSIITGSHEMFIATIEYVHSEKTATDEEGNINFGAIDFL